MLKPKPNEKSEDKLTHAELNKKHKEQRALSRRSHLRKMAHAIKRWEIRCHELASQNMWLTKQLREAQDQIRDLQAKLPWWRK
jgi:hypothetical protein